MERKVVRLPVMMEPRMVQSIDDWSFRTGSGRELGRCANLSGEASIHRQEQKKAKHQ